MIHLDTNFLIDALVAGTFIDNESATQYNGTVLHRCRHLFEPGKTCPRSAWDMAPKAMSPVCDRTSNS